MAATVERTLAVAYWEYGAWTVEHLAPGMPDEICAGGNDGEYVAEILRAELEAAGRPVTRVSVNASGVVAYGGTR
jgi:hypothetical protein